MAILQALFAMIGRAAAGSSVRSSDERSGRCSAALNGEPQLLTGSKEDDMKDSGSENAKAAAAPRATALTTPELIREIGSKSMLLVRKELDLTKQEVKEDARAELAAIKGFAAAIVGAIATLNLLLVAAVFALASRMELLPAALLVAAIVCVLTVIAAAIAWRKRVTRPLERTRKSVEEDVQFVKEQIA
jgi:putative superfamily III holin-X